MDIDSFIKNKISLYDSIINYLNTLLKDTTNRDYFSEINHYIFSDVKEGSAEIQQKLSLLLHEYQNAYFINKKNELPTGSQRAYLNYKIQAYSNVKQKLEGILQQNPNNFENSISELISENSTLDAYTQKELQYILKTYLDLSKAEKHSLEKND